MLAIAMGRSKKRKKELFVSRGEKKGNNRYFVGGKRLVVVVQGKRVQRRDRSPWGGGKGRCKARRGDTFLLCWKKSRF